MKNEKNDQRKRAQVKVKSKINRVPKNIKGPKAKGVRLRRIQEIVIDRAEGLVFKTEDSLLKYFGPKIDLLEQEYEDFQKKYASDEKIKMSDLEVGQQLELTLDSPDEIWHDTKTFQEFPIFHFVRAIEDKKLIHVAISYVSSEDEPTFIFLHFFTTHLELVELYKRGDLVFDKAFEEVEFASLEGDALVERDPIATGLFLAMMKVRGEKDIPKDKFQEIGLSCREITVEDSDEIWRSLETQNEGIVTFIKRFPDHEEGDLYYIAITQEEPDSQLHTLLFSFPTNDETLVERYRHGEDLQAEEVQTESSH